MALCKSQISPPSQRRIYSLLALSHRYISERKRNEIFLYTHSQILRIFSRKTEVFGQIWCGCERGEGFNFRFAYCLEGFNRSPCLVLCLFDQNPIQATDGCPQRLGLLAIACSNGSVMVYR